jgi:hypothetical protein
MAKLSQDVLGAVPEKQFSLEDIQFVLSDALVLLACKEIKRSHPNPIPNPNPNPNLTRTRTRTRT